MTIAINEIGDYWTKKPHKRDIHVLVEPPASTATIRKLTSLKELSGSEFYEPPNKRVKTNNEKVNNFWRDLKNASLTKKFLRLPENTRFLGKKRGLSVLYIRRCYKDLQQFVFDDAIDRLRITGNPGPGKTIFGYYLLYLLAKQNATVIFDSYKEKNPIVFNGEYAFNSNDDGINLYLQDARVWYVVDGKETKDVDDKVDEKLARDLFSKWGGIPRCVLEKANERVYQNKLKDAINSCKEDIFDYIGESSVERTLFSHMVVHIHVNLPLKDDNEVDKDELSQYSEARLQLDRNGLTPYTETILRFASNYVQERVTGLLETRIREKLLVQIKAGTGNPLLGNTFESVAHKMLRNGGNFDVRPLDEYDDGNNDDPDAKVNLPQQNVPFYFRKNTVGVIKDGTYYQAWEKISISRFGCYSQ
ncbi:crinkler (CRN) family protein, putative [Rhizophagus clarus]|uniref:Crinkler (CRN) family protein, putative n=1 Tax=Rhizophagus clarus TaxID=94130 RepID=A0A8H3L9Z3_9GLOM|nr:crinkler (CRN) family protein, putative [Rhizophagus clarus]